MLELVQQDGAATSSNPAGPSAKSVFLSSAHADKQRAREIASALRYSGIRVLNGLDTISAGERWVASLHRLIREVDVVVLLLSETAQSSQRVQLEVAAAIADAEAKPNKWIITVLIDPDVQPTGLLAAYQWLDAVGRSPEQIASMLLEAINELRPISKDAERREAREELCLGMRQLDHEIAEQWLARKSRRNRAIVMLLGLYAITVTTLLVLPWSLERQSAVATALIGALVSIQTVIIVSTLSLRRHFPQRRRT